MHTARQVGITVILVRIGEVLCVLIEQCLDHLYFKSGVVDEQVLSPAICDDTTLHIWSR